MHGAALHGRCFSRGRPAPAPAPLAHSRLHPPTHQHNRLISLEERGQILERLQGADTAIAAGGSLSNTLLALARLGDAGSVASGGVHRPLNVGMAGLLGGDPLGEFFAASLAAAGVQVAAAPVAGAATGTVVVLTSDDASRSMLSYLGSPTEVAVDAALEQAIAASRLLVIEGYLWELPGARRTIGKVREG